MENLKIYCTDLPKDIQIAKGIIGRNLEKNLDIFDDYSMVYRVSNENMADSTYLKAFKNKKRVLAITASGDQILNSILFGGEDITGIDVSNFPKYYVALKFAALKSLTKEEYLHFILGNKVSPPLSKELYGKVRLNMCDDSRLFWDSIFSNFTEKEIDDSPFFGYFNLSENRVTKTCPYLQGDNFDLIKKMLDSTEIRLLTMDLTKLNEDLGRFDLILLSNVLYYITEKYKSFEDKIEVYKKIMRSLPLNPNGLVLSYNFTMDGYIGQYFREKGFHTSRVDENISSIFLENEIITYEKNQNKSLIKLITGNR